LTEFQGTGLRDEPTFLILIIMNDDGEDDSEDENEDRTHDIS